MVRILLLEPNRLLAQQYSAYLAERGYKAVWCEDAQAGITAADTGKPDLVIVELLLAGHSGIEFLYEFRSYAEWRNVPAIVLTSLSPQEIDLSEQRAHELGIVARLYKSETSLAKLAIVIERALQPAPKGA